MKNIQNLTIDINKKPFQSITANVGEVASRFIRITVLENNIPADLTGVTAYLYAKKADGTKVFNSVTVENAKQGIVLAELTSQVLAVPGLARLTLLLTKDGAKLASKQIIVTVDESNIDEEAIQSTNEFNALTDALAKVNNVDKKADKSYVDNLVSSVVDGSPKGVYATLSALKTAIPKGDNNIYVVTDDGCWYYWNGSAWTNGGIYQSTGISDGSVKLKSFDSEIISQVRTMGNERILPTVAWEGTPWINIDTTNKMITITEESGGKTTAWNKTTLEKHSQSGVSRGVTELYYGDYSTSAIYLYYNTVDRVYFIQGFSEKALENSIFIMGIRTDGRVYTTRPIDVTINGKTDPMLIERIDSALFESARGGKTLFSTSREGFRHHIIWDGVNKQVTIPKTMEFMYKNTPVNRDVDVVITYTDGSTLLAFGYHTKTKQFAVMPYNELKKHSDFALYDFIRTENGKMQSVFTNNIFFVGISDLKYISPYELGKDNKNYRLVYVNPSLGMSEYTIDNKNISVAYRYKATPTKQVTYIHNRNSEDNLYSDAIRFTERDNVGTLRLTLPNPSYKFYWSVRCPNIDKVNHPTVNMWAIKSYGPSTAGSTLSINIARYLTLAKKSYNCDAIFVEIQMMKADESVFTEEELNNLQLHVDVVKHAKKVSNYESLTNTLDITQPIVKSTTPNKSPRIMFKDPIYATSEQVVMYGLDNREVTYKGDTINIYMGLHGYNINNKQVYDANWQIGNIGDVEAPNYYEYNAYTHMYQRYSQYPFDNIDKINHYYIYIGMGSANGISYTLDEVKEICELFTIKYEVRDLTEVERGELLEHPGIKSRLVNQIIKVDDEEASDDSIHIVDEQIFTANKSALVTCVIPARARGYIVEFRGKVSNGTGYIQFSDSYDKMSIVNTEYRSFKMRFNKSDYAKKNISVNITIPSEGTISIRNLKVIPVYEEIAPSNHNRASNYLHRAYSSAYPENSLLAVEEACKRGCSIIELDLFTSTDNKVLFVHDQSLGRTNKARPTVSYSDTSLFNYKANNMLNISSSIINEFEVNDYLTIVNNGNTVYATIESVNTVNNTITLSTTSLAGNVTKVTNGRKNVARCSEAEFMEYEIGEYMNERFKGEYNRPLEDYMKVLSKYETALLLDIRELRESCFKNHLAPVLDRYDYWDKCYFMNSIGSINNYHRWAKDINRKIVGMPILWSTGDKLINSIKAFGDIEYSNMIRKDIAIESIAATKENIDLAHSYGMRVHVFTVNSMTEAQRALRLGVDIIGGDYYSDDTSILW